MTALLLSLLLGGAAAGGGSSTVAASLTTSTTWYVDTAGNDGNSCLSSSAPCLTYPGAFAKIPKSIEGVIATVQGVAGQTYSGFLLPGFNVYPSSTGAQGGLRVVGSWTTSTLATGSATGTLTAGSNSSGSTFATATDAGATWTTNDLAKKWIRFASGGGSSASSRYQIKSNTGTVITFIGSAFSHTAGTTYVIEEPSSTLSTILPAEAATMGSAFNASLLRVVNNSGGGISTSPVSIEGFIIAPSSSAIAVFLDGDAKVAFRWNKFSANTSQGILTLGSSKLFLLGNYFNGLTSSALNATNGFVGHEISGNYFDGGSVALLLGGTKWLISNNYFKSQTTASLSVGNSGSVTTSQFNGNQIDGSAIGISVAAGNASGGPTAAFGINGNDISNCTTAGVDLTGGNTEVWATALTGTGNAIGVRVRFGAKMEFSSTSSTITGTTPLVIDTTTTETLTTMRAASPRVLPATASPYGTAVFE